METGLCINAYVKQRLSSTVSCRDRLTHLSGQLGPVGGSVSAAVLQSPVCPLLKPFPVALPSKPETFSNHRSLAVARHHFCAFIANVGRCWETGIHKPR